MTRSRDPEGRLRRPKASTARTCNTVSSSEQPDGQSRRETATDPLTVSRRCRFRTCVHSRERGQMTRSRDLGGRARQTKAPAGRTCTVTISCEQSGGQRWRETATDPLTVPTGVELLEAPSRARSRESATGDQEGVARGG